MNTHTINFDNIFNQGDYSPLQMQVQQSERIDYDNILGFNQELNFEKMLEQKMSTEIELPQDSSMMQPN